MKHRSVWALLLALLAVLSSLSLLTACDNGGGEDTTTPAESETTPETSPEDQFLQIVLGGASEYIVVRPEGASGTLVNTARQVITNLERYTGAKLKLTDDFLNKFDPNVKAPDYEILVGQCNRDECREIAATLRSKDFFAGVVGTKIVLMGLNDEMTQRAVDNFVTKIVTKKCRDNPDGLRLSEEDNIRFTYGSYTLNSCTLLGHDLTEFSVSYYNAAAYSAERTARLFADYIANGSGHYLPVSGAAKNALTNDKYQIVFGTTDTAGTQITARHGFTVTASGQKMYVCAECELGYAAALEYLTGTLFRGDTVTIPENFSYTGAAGALENGMQYIDQKLGSYRVLFHNILGNCDTSIYPTPTRNQMAAELHLEYDPDFLCLQECSGNSRGSSSYISTMAQHGFVEVQVTVNNKDKINYTPLLYRKDRFTVVESGYHLYSDGAGDKSKSITWGVFEEIATGKRVAVLSTHFYWTGDDLGKSARILDAQQIVKLAGEISGKYDVPVIAGGDLNCNISSDPMRNMFTAGFKDIRDMTAVSEDSNSHHAYPEYNADKKLYDKMTYPSGTYSSAIDHAVVWNSAKFTAKLFEIITDDYALLSSDHCPLIVDFDLK